MQCLLFSAYPLQRPIPSFLSIALDI
jgi:addiction module HigA family antidote